jgi:hypothetical protein
MAMVDSPLCGCMRTEMQEEHSTELHLIMQLLLPMHHPTTRDCNYRSVQGQQKEESEQETTWRIGGRGGNQGH